MMKWLKKEIKGTLNAGIYEKIRNMSTRELKEAAIRHGGVYEEQYIERKQREQEIEKRVRS